MIVKLTKQQAEDLLEVIDFAMIENARKLERGFMDTIDEDVAQRLQDDAIELAKIVNRAMKGKK